MYEYIKPSYPTILNLSIENENEWFRLIIWNVVVEKGGGAESRSGVLHKEEQNVVYVHFKCREI